MKRLLNPATTLTTLRKLALTFLCCTALMVLAASAQTRKQIKLNPGANAAPNTAANNGPPPGAIMDLASPPQAIPGGGNNTYQQYTVNFVAADIPSTAITFAFREDPAFISFSNASVVDLSAGNGTNLLVNGDFSQGTVGSTAVGWTYSNQYGASSGGVVESSCGVGLTGAYGVGNCWYDGAVQAYDAISQPITTVPGHNYQISFWVADDSACRTEPAGTPCNFSDVSTNGNVTDTGGNGINVTVYAQAGLPPPNQTLTVNLLDSGTGTVTDNTEAISCSESSGTVTGTCSASYPIGTVVTLTATVGSGSTFAGWGGACSSSGTNTTCTVTMNSAQNVTASFDIPGQTVTQTVNTDTQATFNYNGGYANGGTDYIAQLLSGSQVTASVTEITFASQAACNSIFTNTPFAGAQCFVAQNGGTGTATVAYELTCPGYPGTNGTCGSDANANFFATLGSDFSFNIGDNPGLAETPNKTLTYNGGNPLVGFLKYVGPDPLHPCTLSPNSPPVSLSNQISSFTFVDPGALPVKGGSSGTGSCWLVTYGTPGEAPTVTVAAPVNNGVYLQNQNDSTTKANYTCTTANNGSAATGPYLTQASCSAIDSPGGSVGQGAQFDTATPGPHTFTATVMDSAANTASQTVSYDVQGSQTINFPAIPTQTYGAGPLTLNATASSGLPVTYAVTSGPATVVGNVLTITGVGSVTVMASQAGNNFYAPATASQTFAVIPASTTTTVTSSLNPSAYGQTVTFTAHVTGAGNPTGSVTWSANTGCGPTVLSAGAATCTTSSLTPGTDVIMAAYSGDTNNVASSGTLNQMVSAPQLTLTPTSINFGNVYLFNVAVKTLTLKNTGNATLQISGVSLTFGQADHDFGFVNTCPASLAPGKSCIIYLGFWADQLGIQTGTLVITDNAPGSPQHVAITGNGIKKH